MEKVTRVSNVIQRAINDFDRAAQRHAFKGSYPPDVAADIEDDYRTRRAALESRIVNAINRAKGT